jgi:hypothetical protein
MNGLFKIACGIGVQDSLNPCIFMACAVLIALGLWLAGGPFKMAWLRILFVLVYALSFFEFNFGEAQILILRKEIVFAVKIVYFVLGVCAFILGTLFLKDWYLLSRGQILKNPAGHQLKPLTNSGPGALALAFLLAVVLSAMATIAPINKYIYVLSSEVMAKGLWREALPMLAGYIFSSMWPLLLLVVFLSLKNLRPSLLKILFASIFITASSCVVFIFK